jgi:hypothetical protein
MSDSFLKPDLQASLLCDDVRQEMNGKFMLIGLFERLGFPEFPGAVPKFCIVNRWCCGEGTYTQQTRIMAPDGVTKVVEGRAVEIKLQNETAVATSVEFFVNLRFPSPGTYWVEVTIDHELKIRHPLLVGEIRQA